MHHTEEQPAHEPAEPVTAERPAAAGGRPGDDRPADGEHFGGALGASPAGTRIPDAAPAGTRDQRPDLADYEPL